MAFNSLSYFFFLTVIYLIFYFIADRLRWLVLLGASYVFYAGLKAPYLQTVLLMVTVISYICGKRMAAKQNVAIRKRWFLFGSSTCIAVLVLSKYFPFLESQSNIIFGLNNTLSQSLVSIGVSYFTFQAISYLADIYLEIEKPEMHFGHYALYMAFFPKLLQGPIERAGDLIPQLKKPYEFDYDTIRSGMLLFTWGLFKKVVVADRLSLYADQVFNNIHEYTGLPLIIGIYAYAFQIYFDFSAYTDMARGTGRIFGINLTENFNSPYLATSIADFWRRWHISFSKWILDYIFKPLQLGLRNWSRVGTPLALIITFLVSGIWHGATWGFVIWGLLHGFYLATSIFYRPYQKKLHMWLGVDKNPWLKWWQVIITFNLVSFAWVFFRARSLEDAMYISSNLFNGVNGIRGVLLSAGKLNLLVVVILAVFFIILINCVDRCKTSFKNLKLFRWSLYYALLLVILFLGKFGESHFLYFKF